MTQLNLFVNSMPRDLTEFAFFIVVGFTAGSMGLIQKINKYDLIINFYCKNYLYYFLRIKTIKS